MINLLCYIGGVTNRGILGQSEEQILTQVTSFSLSTKLPGIEPCAVEE